MYSFPRKGDILLSAAGTLGKTVEYNGKDAYYQDSNIIWLNTDTKIIKNIFLKHLYATINWDKIIEGSTIKRLYNSDILNKTVHITSLKEQKAIGNTLNNMDRLVNLESQKLIKLKQFKQSMLQKLLPRKGQTEPEVRFAGFNGEWQEVTLDEVTLYKSSNYTVNDFVEGGKYPLYDAQKLIGYLPGYDIDKPYISIVKDGAGVGRVRLLPSKSSVIATMGYILTIDNIADEKFIYYNFSTMDFDKYIVGSTIPHIYYKDYSNEAIYLPSLAEQKSIGSFFSNLDQRIDSQQQKLTKIKQFKQSLLQKMFV